MRVGEDTGGAAGRLLGHGVEVVGAPRPALSVAVDRNRSRASLTTSLVVTAPSASLMPNVSRHSGAMPATIS